MKNVALGKASIVVADLAALTTSAGFEILHVVDDIISFRWTRKSRDCDEFELVVPGTFENLSIYSEDRILVANDFNIRKDDGSVIYRKTDSDFGLYDGPWYPFTDMAGVIEKIDMKTPNKEGEPITLTITGRSLECLLDRRIVWNYTVLDLYNCEEEHLDGTYYADFISKIYEFLSDEMFAPDVQKAKGKKKSNIENFQNRAIWNFVMGDYSGRTQYTDPDALAKVEQKYSEAENYMKKFLNDENTFQLELEGQTLLTVVKDICSTFGLSLRANLLINVPRVGDYPDADGIWEGYDKMDMGKYGSTRYFRTTKAAYISDPRHLEIPAGTSWIFLELDVPTNRSYIENTNYDYVVFSQNVDNLQNIQFVKDWSNVKNITLVKGDDLDGKKPVYEKVMNGDTEPKGLSRRETFTDATNIEREKKSNKYYEKEYKPLMLAAGRKTLFENSRNVGSVFDGDAISGFENDFYKLGEDYYVGDLVQFVDSSYGESSRVQVSEVTETVDSSGYVFSMSYDTPVLDFNYDDEFRYYYYITDEENSIITITGIKLAKVKEDNLTELPIDGKLWNTGELQSITGDNDGVAKVKFDNDKSAEEFKIKWERSDGNSSAGHWWVDETVYVNGYDIALNLTYSI